MSGMITRMIDFARSFLYYPRLLKWYREHYMPSQFKNRFHYAKWHSGDFYFQKRTEADMLCEKLDKLNEVGMWRDQYRVELVERKTDGYCL